ncbi:MAG TPA: dodecin family protein [Actinomycetota bacterium]|nr:dodecin family protein [Actinomycetota bacterium]
MPRDIPGAVVKILELVGSSPNSFSDAVRNAVEEASRTIRNIRGVDVLQSSADVGDDGEISLYKVNVKIAFVIDRGDDESSERSSRSSRKTTARRRTSRR